jgi:hypothetical protein
MARDRALDLGLCATRITLNGRNSFVHRGTVLSGGPDANFVQVEVLGSVPWSWFHFHFPFCLVSAVRSGVVTPVVSGINSTGHL